MPLPEKALISRIRRQARPTSVLATGIGDDCAVLRPPKGHELLVTTDFTLENVHFRQDWHPPQVVGRRCLTRGLSDVAAMGGVPLAVFLSLALPRSLRQRWADRFLDGLLELAGEFRVSLAGGDLAQSPATIAADIVVVGSVPSGKAILRSGARPGDSIYVTGQLGGSAAAVLAMQDGGRARPADYPRHFYPVPRIAIGRVLRTRNLASAMIDLSDGLSTDLAHICEESGVAAEIDARQIPYAQVGRPVTPVSLDLALHGGEDYELIFTSSKRIPPRLAGVPVTRIGRITRGQGMTLISETGRRKLLAGGWEHFRK